MRQRLVTAAQVGPFALLVLLLVGIPLLPGASDPFRESSFLGVSGGPTLEQYRLVFESGSTIKVMLRTALVALGVATTVTALAFTIA